MKLPMTDTERHPIRFYARTVTEQIGNGRFDELYEQALRLERENAALRKGLERLLGCPPNCRQDEHPGCAACMSSIETLVEWAMTKPLHQTSTSPSDAASEVSNQDHCEPKG